MAEKSKNLGMDLYGPDDAVDIDGLSVNFNLVDEETGRMRETATTLAQRSGALEAEIAKRPQKPAQYTAGRLAALDGNGNLMDSGKGIGDLAVAGHTHTAAQVSGLPTSLPANGGNADKVDGMHSHQFCQWVSTQSADFCQISNTQIPYIGDIADVEAPKIGLPAGWWHMQYFPHSNANGYGAQIAVPLNFSDYPRWRMAQGGVWGVWKKFVNEDNFLFRSGGAMTGPLTAGGNQAEWEAQVRNVIIYGAGTNPATIPVPAAGTLVAIKK